MIILYSDIHLLIKISLFEPSSSAKIVLHRGYQHSDILKVPVGKHEGKVVDLLENASGE